LYTTGGVVVIRSGAVLPDHAGTAGAVNPEVGQERRHHLCVWLDDDPAAVELHDRAEGTAAGDRNTGDYGRAAAAVD
jgi:hypothetical protein